MTPQERKEKKLHHQILCQYSLLEEELAAIGKEVPPLPLSEPLKLLNTIKILRATIARPS